ncbi:daptide biosynthesis RiPP recognition protein [Microbacterium sp. MYb62]|uniref:daptide biosynthesis RiPP recognition protein n=1 Tax=Microbacterium sp. MYb62 TaxID=1848690 RepID=UPI000CFBC514|nr:daptide biosynthesis RiPP recognition protein [Microbacterium sp. MYb62]PRB11779.1 hypothetical protein CQ042_16125 [Microbacterium sp. MYb62]
MRANSVTAPRSDHRTTTAFEQYVSGRRAILEGAVFFLESGEHVAEVLSQAGPGDVVFAPTGSALHRDPRVVGYDGRFREPGDEMMLGDRRSYELQDYVAAPFITILAPTVIRQGRAEGVAAFLGDADMARDSGVFVDQLLSNAVLLDSIASFLGADPAGDSLVRVHMTRDGEYRDGPDGLLLGVTGDERADLEARALEEAGRGRAFACIVDCGMLEADLDDRPWLARYVGALDLLRHWDGVPSRPAISGFGGHLVRALEDLPALAGAVSADAPYLLTGDGEEYVLIDAARGRRFRLGIDAARAAECLIATADEAAASALLAAETGQRVGSVAPVVRELQARFAAAGLHLTANRRDGA